MDDCIFTTFFVFVLVWSLYSYCLVVFFVCAFGAHDNRWQSNKDELSWIPCDVFYGLLAPAYFYVGPSSFLVDGQQSCQLRIRYNIFSLSAGGLFRECALPPISVRFQPVRPLPLYAVLLKSKLLCQIRLCYEVSWHWLCWCAGGPLWHAKDHPS